MKEYIKRSGIRVLSSAPFYTALRAGSLLGNPTSILCYHTLRPSSETFDAWTVLRLKDFQDQIAFLRQNYELVSLSNAMARHGEPGRPRLVLTFDDGEWGLFEHLLPVVEAQKIPVTVYVATRQIETGTPFWFDRVMNVLQVKEPLQLQLNLKRKREWRVDVETGKMRWKQIGAVLEALKEVPEEERDRLADMIAAQAGSSTLAFAPLRPMTADELRNLATHPLVTIGAHSHGHELLDQLPVGVASASIARSKAWLENLIGEPVHHFAYPNGNYTIDLMAEIARLGFETATTLDERLVDASADRFALPRIGIGRYDALDRIKLRLVRFRKGALP